MSSSFGFIIATHAGDYHLAKGCCASLRYFCGDVPICLIVDDDTDVSNAQRAYGVRVLRRSQAKHVLLRSRRSPTKMIAFWESPWEHFFYLDADTVAWGDLRKLVDSDQHDMIVDLPTYGYTEANIKQWFFDGPRVERYFPTFAWRIPRYFCAGVFVAKRGIWTLREYEDILDLKEANPGMFFGWDQGIQNLMVFRAASEGRLRLGQKRLQVIVPDYPVGELRQRFPVGFYGPQFNTSEPIVIHWAGTKPSLRCTNLHSKPMDFFRLRFLKDAGGPTGTSGLIKLWIEDVGCSLWHLRRRLNRRLQRRKAALPSSR